MSTQPFSIRVKIGNHEIEISGTKDEVLKTLEELPNIVTKVSQAFGTTAPSVAVSTLSQASEPVAERLVATGVPYPPITQAKSCGDAVFQLLNSDWGREKPRALNDIATALKANALHYPVASIAKNLERLVRRNKLRRWKTEEGYVYVLA